MTYIPKLAYELQTFDGVESLNHHMNLHYQSLKHHLTESGDRVFHSIKKYSCKVAGVCWLKQETLAKAADVSIKTVERTVKWLTEAGVMKIYHTKRSNGLNGNCYYVLQPFIQQNLAVDVEEISSIEEANVGADESLLDQMALGHTNHEKSDKLFKSSYKTSINSTKTTINSFSTSKKGEGFDELMTFWDQNGFGATNHYGKQQLLLWLDQTCFIQPFEMILKAMYIACDQNQRKLSYVVGILKNWQKASLRTLDEIDSYQENKQKSVAKTKKITEITTYGRAIPRESEVDFSAGEDW
ncbi:DnaD domain protein [Pseudoneobacillus sp. C159]